MRLTKYEINTFVSVIHNEDRNAVIYLFGSRVDDSKLGGDIDILIHSKTIDKYQLRQIKWKLIELLGEQKLDIMLSSSLEETFVKLILPTAMKLH